MFVTRTHTEPFFITEGLFSTEPWAMKFIASSNAQKRVLTVNMSRFIQTITMVAWCAVFRSSTLVQPVLLSYSLTTLDEAFQLFCILKLHFSIRIFSMLYASLHSQIFELDDSKMKSTKLPGYNSDPGPPWKSVLFFLWSLSIDLFEVFGAV